MILEVHRCKTYEKKTLERNYLTQEYLFLITQVTKPFLCRESCFRLNICRTDIRARKFIKVAHIKIIRVRHKITIRKIIVITIIMLSQPYFSDPVTLSCSHSLVSSFFFYVKTLTSPPLIIPPVTTPPLTVVYTPEPCIRIHKETLGSWQGEQYHLGQSRQIKLYECCHGTHRDLGSC